MREIGRGDATIHMHILRLVCILALATACGPSSTRRRPSSRLPPVIAVVDADGKPVADALVTAHVGSALIPVVTVRSSADGSVVLSLPPRTTAVSAASKAGYAWLTDMSTAPRRIVLSNDCRVVKGRFVPPTDSSGERTLLHATLLAQSFATFTMAPDPRGEFSACVPQGEYVAVSRGDRISIPAGFRTSDDSELIVTSFSRKEIEKPAKIQTPPVSIAMLADAISDEVRVVGIGESNHGTSEFLALRGQLMFSLTKRTHPVVLMLEAGVGETFALDDFVLGKPVDVEAAVDALGYWMWNTREFISMLQEIRTYNASALPDAKIRVLGFDVQDTVAATDTLLASLTLSASEKAVLARLREDRGRAAAALLGDDRTLLSSVLERSQRQVPGPDLSAADTRVILAGLALQMRIEALRGDLLGSVRMRDLGMAVVIAAVLSLSPQSRVVALAHNSHLARESSMSVKTLGQHMAESLGRAYFPIGLYSLEGEAWAWNPGGTKREAVKLSPSPLHSLESAVARPNDVVIVPFTEAPRQLLRWLESPRFVREFGAQYSDTEADYTLRKLPLAFDAVVVVSRGSATTQVGASAQN